MSDPIYDCLMAVFHDSNFMRLSTETRDRIYAVQRLRDEAPDSEDGKLAERLINRASHPHIAFYTQLQDNAALDMLVAARLTTLSAERDSLLIRVERAEAALRGVLDWYGGPTAHPERWSECMIAARAALSATETR